MFYERRNKVATSPLADACPLEQAGVATAVVLIDAII